MPKYLRVSISGRYGDEVHFVELEDRPYSQAELEEIGQDTVNEQYSWGIGDDLVDQEDVPEGQR